MDPRDIDRPLHSPYETYYPPTSQPSRHRQPSHLPEDVSYQGDGSYTYLQSIRKPSRQTLPAPDASLTRIRRSSHAPRDQPEHLSPPPLTPLPDFTLFPADPLKQLPPAPSRGTPRLDDLGVVVKPHKSSKSSSRSSRPRPEPREIEYEYIKPSDLTGGLLSPPQTPRTPTISRLSTPEIDPYPVLCPPEAFCSCCPYPPPSTSSSSSSKDKKKKSQRRSSKMDFQLRDARAYIEAQRKHDMDEEELERRRSGKSAEKGAQLCKTTGAQPLVSVRYDYDVVSVAHRDRSVRR